MPYTIHHHGVPIVATDQQSADDLSGINWRPLPAFDAVRATVRARWEALRPNPAGGYGGRERALRAGAELSAALELRDARGGLIPTQLIELWELPEAPDRIMVTLFLDEAVATKLATRPLRERRDAAGAPEA